MVAVVARPHLFSDRDLAQIELPAGLTIAEILDAAGWNMALADYTRVYVDHRDVPAEYWSRARPKEGRHILVALVPGKGDGGGKSVIAAIASIAIMIVAPFAAAGLAGYAVSATGVAQAAAGLGAASFGALVGGIGLAGNLAISALFKPAKINNSVASFSPNTSPAYSITGQSNVKTPGQPCLKIYGRHRIHPRIIADPYVTVEGAETFMHMIVDWGYAPLEVSDIRIGDTPLDAFTDKDTNTIIYPPLDPANPQPLRIYTTDVATLPLSYTLQYQEPVLARTRTDARVATLDFFYPGGLIGWHKDFSVPLTLQSWIGLEYRDVTNGGAWLPFSAGGAVTIQAPKGAGIDSGGFAFYARPTTIEADINGLPTHYGFIAGTSSFSVVSSRLPPIGSVFQFAGQARTVTAIAGQQVSFSPPLSTFVVTEEARRYPVDRFDGEREWMTLPPSDVALSVAPTGSRVVIENNELKAFSVSVRIEFAAPSEYEFRVTRLSQHKIPPNFDPNSFGRDAFDPDSVIDDVMWISVKSFAIGRPPIAPAVPRTITEFRIRSSDQFTGIINTISGIVQARLPTRVGGVWDYRATSNPAWAYIDVLCGTWNPRRVSLDMVDIAAFEEWAAMCDAVPSGGTKPRFEFNAVIDYPIRADLLMESIASAARAAPTRMSDGRYSILVDSVTGTQRVQVFTPLNSWGFSGSRLFADIPHAFRVKFIDPDSNWEERSLLAWDDGYYDPELAPGGYPGLTPATIVEELPTFGVTNAEQAWRLGRITLAEARLRPTEYYLTADIEHMVCQRGNRVGVQSLTFGAGGVAGLVAEVIDATTLRMTEPFGAIDPAGQYGLVVRQADGPVSNTIACHPLPGSDIVWRTEVAHGAEVGDVCVWGFADRVITDFIVKEIEPGPDMTAKLKLMDVGAGIMTSDYLQIPPYFPPQGGRPDGGFGITPTGLKIELSDILVDRVWCYDVRLTWDANTLAHHWLVYRVNSRTGARLPLHQVHAPTDLALDDFDRRYVPAAGEDLTFEVTGVSRTGAESPGARKAVRVYPDTTAPLPPRNFAASVNSRMVSLAWAPPVEEDVILHEIRFSPSLTAWDWVSAEIVARKIPRDVVSMSFPARVGTYLLKSLDSAGNYSAYTAVTQVKEIPEGSGNVVLQVDVGAGRNWAGTTYDCTVVAGALKADGADHFWLRDDLPFWGADTDPFWSPTVWKEMRWAFSIEVPADGVGTDMRLSVTITGGYSIDYSRDAITWTTFPGRALAEAGTYHFRIDVSGGAVRGVISAAYVVFDVPDLEEIIPSITVDSGGTRLPITQTFRAITAVIGTVDKSSANTAISVGVIDLDPDLGPLVKCIDAAGAYVSGKAAFLVRGY